MDFRSLPCVFLGYSTSHKGYLCLHRSTSRIYISRHVVFSEDTFPFATSSLFSVSPASSTPTAPPSSTTLLQQAHFLPSPHSETSQRSPGSSRTTSLSTPSPSPPLPNTPLPPCPSHQRPTISSQAKQTPPTIFRPAANTQHPMVTRARTNSLKPKAFLTTTSSPPTTEPRNLPQALHNPYWLNAMKNEYDALIRNKTWTLVSRPTNANIVGCKWLFRIKRHSDGKIERYKARLVAQGFVRKKVSISLKRLVRL